MSRLLLVLAVASFLGSSVLAAETLVPTATLHVLEKREDPPIPTVTFRPIENYLVKRGKDDPLPAGDKLQIYPQGIYNDFPQDGVTMVFGPDLKKRIIDTMGSDCQANQEACRNRLIPILDNTDVNTHAKRFLLISAYLAFELIWATAYIITAAAVAGAAWLASESPAVKFEYGDLDQLHRLGGANKVGIAMQNNPDAPPATIVVPGTPIKPTPTGPDYITLETLTADSDKHKKGDIVFHIPVDSARRIQDLLGMLGVQHLVEACNGIDLLGPQMNRQKRATPQEVVERCMNLLGETTSLVAETVPDDAMQLAPQFFPAQPAPGDVIAFPVQNLVFDEVHVVVVPYHLMRQHMRAHAAAVNPLPAVPQFHVPTFVRSTLSMIILSYAAYNAGQMVADIFVSKDAFSTAVKEDEFTCPIDILCIDEACGAQTKDDRFVAGRNAVCKKKKNKGCRCEPIYFPDHNEVEAGYMDAQYSWLQELIQLADKGEQKFEPKCQGDLQQSNELSEKWKDTVKEMCKKHKDLRANTNIRGGSGDMFWQEAANGDKDPVTWSFSFTTNPNNKEKTCSFECEDIFNAFADSKDCNKGNGVLKSGGIDTDCGHAHYGASRRYLPSGGGF